MIKQKLIVFLKYLKKNGKKFILFLPILTLPFIWLRGGFGSIYLHLDFARDLQELSNMWIGKIVWLGPELRPNFHITPFYYYFFYPSLLIGGGNIRAMILFNVLVSFAFLAWFGWLTFKKHKSLSIILAVLVVGLAPFWQKISIYPGNGDTYAIFILASLVSMWFFQPFWLTSGLVSTAVAFHPTSVFILPLFLYHFFLEKKHYLKNFLIALVVFIIPWLPNLYFAVITKGYWIKKWLSGPSLRVSLSLNFQKNIKNILSFERLSGINIFIILAIWIMVGFMIKKKFKFWYFLTSFLIILLFFMNPLPDRYLYGILTMAFFITAATLITKKIGRLILFMLTIILLVNTIKTPMKKAERSVISLEKNVNFIIQKNQINKNQKIALLTVLEPISNMTPGRGLAPQSNDYRFILRVKGYNALDVPEYAQADVLVMFIEDSDFDWQNWISWEISEFGEKKQVFSSQVDNTKIIVFESKD
jgi:hypothetical protein